ncbi:HipA domain-containing protein (plasmid) [Vibrio campbellii]|uniref:HipA domain-containing protein n=1 Tax=Vibrio campbellii TaxID=680 RepID=A0ABY5IL76_9VIBR|nr:HipA domain-containing protein [Vibrio campbellii]UTZ34985.1 HipA domain-containing protein [Vibrio campbellii]
MKSKNTSIISSKPTVLTPCLAKDLGSKGNIELENFKQLIADDKAYLLNLYINEKKSGILLGIESPTFSMHQQFAPDIQAMHIRSAIYEQVDTFSYWMNLLPSPESLNKNTPVRDNFWNFHSPQFKEGENSIRLSVTIGSTEHTLYNATVTKLPVKLLKYLMSANTRFPYELNDKTYDYIPESIDVDKIKSKVSKFFNVSVSMATALLFAKELKTENDLNDLLSIIQTRFDIDVELDKISELIPNLYQMAEYYFTESNGLLDARENVAQIDDLITVQSSTIEKRLGARRAFIDGILDTFTVKHYGLPVALMINHYEQGVLALPDFGSIDSNHNSRLTNLVKNLLPEHSKSENEDINLREFVSKNQRLISSFAFEPTNFEHHFAALRTASYIPRCNKLNADTIDFHSTTLSSDHVFGGEVDDLPKNDKHFLGKIKSDFLEAGGVLISGVQSKLLMNLYQLDETGEQRLQVSRGNIKSTHIAKFPMLGRIDNLAVAEWLGLTLTKAAGLKTSKFQLVRSTANQPSLTHTNNDEATENLVGETDIMRSILGDVGARNEDSPFSMNEIFEADNDTEFDEFIQSHVINESVDSMSHPPFIVIERFDIAHEQVNPNTQYISQDFCALAQRESSKKYDYDFEGVAAILKSHIVDNKMLKEAQEHLLRLIVASLAIANNDLHLKNLSLLTTVNEQGVHIGLSPVYDVLCAPMVSPIINEYDYKQAMPISGTCRPSITNIIDYAVEHLDFDKGAATAIVRDVIFSIRSEVQTLKSNIDTIFNNDPTLTERLKEGLQYVNRNVNHIIKHGVEWSKGQRERTYTP